MEQKQQFLNKYVKRFLQRGIAFGGFGPIITIIIYAIVAASSGINTITNNPNGVLVIESGNISNSTNMSNKIYYAIDIRTNGGIGDSVVTSKNQGLEAYIGKEVILGVRPENLSVSNGDENNHIHATVSIAELMGSESNLYLVTDGQNMIARVPADLNIKEEQAVTLVADENKMHVFDPETEKVILG